MAANLAKWPSNRGLISKIRPSDGCKGNTVPSTVVRGYDLRKPGGHLGNVGSTSYFTAGQAAAELIPNPEQRRYDAMAKMRSALWALPYTTPTPVVYLVDAFSYLHPNLVIRANYGNHPSRTLDPHSTYSINRVSCLYSPSACSNHAVALPK